MTSAISTANTQQPKPSHHVMQQAAEWYALLKSEEITKSEKARWHAWLNDSPEHRLAWDYVESVSSRFMPIRSTVDPRRTAAGLQNANARLLKRRQVLLGMAGLAGSGLLGLFAWQHTTLPSMVSAWQADYHTATGEIRDIVLADGTRVWLNTASAINQRYSSYERRLELVMGEILIDTASDASRPFFVDTPQGRLQALGTRFSVRFDEERTFLAVYEGAVKACNHTGNHIVLPAGQQIHFSTNAFGKAQQADVARQAWSQGILVAQDIALRDVVEELRRYHSGHIGLAPEVANLRVFGNFSLRDTDKTLDMLANVLPVRIQRTLPWWVSIEARKE